MICTRVRLSLILLWCIALLFLILKPILLFIPLRIVRLTSNLQYRRQFNLACEFLIKKNFKWMLCLNMKMLMVTVSSVVFFFFSGGTRWKNFSGLCYKQTIFKHSRSHSWNFLLGNVGVDFTVVTRSPLTRDKQRLCLSTSGPYFYIEAQKYR